MQPTIDAYMNASLTDAVRRYADAHADGAGIARTAIPGLTMIRATAPSGLDYAICRPLVCLVVQGNKQVMTGTQTLPFGAGDSLLIASDLPTVSQITHASGAEPYYSLVLDLSFETIAELMYEPAPVSAAGGELVGVQPTDAEVADAALRLVRLLARPAAVPVLSRSLVREMHYWLLCGRHGAAMRRLGLADSHAPRLARAVNVLRTEFAQPLPISRLADAAGMSVSSFHRHFRAATSLSPLQFQKHLRLIEARRLMMAEGVSASSAAFAVGYESVQQFTREYRRMFGLPPGRDSVHVRGPARLAV
ncbi:AraC family transcriptional regulator [Chitinasiproducens palmae]|uniref:AraC-type DNA-binding protein n=1 Tax=Chitinasiproducens palmae TaxID=1770053 RepID=A0A1H2PUC4_9BURK|nr:AraC family transcriptional regulator [Chitinasiproducens palmae]SDV50777.1 AraC-type DNA-binding protein [Chitinasiproducens palmae]